MKVVVADQSATAEGEAIALTGNAARLRERISKAIPDANRRSRALKKFIGKKLPVTKWMRNYNKRSLYYDFIAGVTVGLMLVPQSLAYSALAGLSPEYGLYASCTGVFTYFLFGTSRDLQMGPAALVAMLVDKYTKDGEHKIVYATSLALFSGLVLILMSIFRLQFLIDFISVPVLAGFTSAAAIKIATSQLKGMFGLSLPRGNFFHTLYGNFANLAHAQVADSVLGFTCLAIFIALRQVGAWNMKRKPKNGTAAIVKKVLWFVCTARFTLAVIVTTIMAQILYECFDQRNVFTLAGEMTSGVPQPKVPLTNIIKNGTVFETKADIIRYLGVGCIITPFVAFLETIAVAKTLSRKSNYKIDVTQELFSLGIVNVIGSFFSAFPVAGSFSRSALNSQCSVKTQFGGFFTGSVVLLAVSFLTPWFKYIPRATLSAMIIAAIIPLFEYHIVPMLWRTKKIDLVTMTVTFLVCFYETELGILAGVAVALCIFVYENVELRLTQETDDTCVIFRIESQSISYPTIDQLMSKLDKTVGSKKSKPELIILDMRHVTRIDSTSALALHQFSLSLRVRDINSPKMVFRNAKGLVHTVMRNLGLTVDEEVEFNIMSEEEGRHEEEASMERRHVQNGDGCEEGASGTRRNLYPIIYPELSKD